MFKKITLFFENLTRKNWGLPYHFILVNVATALYIHWFKLETMEGLEMQLYTIALFLFASGYEFWQTAKKGQSVVEMMQDMLANVAGYVFAILPLVK